MPDELAPGPSASISYVLIGHNNKWNGVERSNEQLHSWVMNTQHMYCTESGSAHAAETCIVFTLSIAIVILLCFECID